MSEIQHQLPSASVIKKSNALARAGYTLSLRGHRLFGVAVAALSVDDTVFPHVAVSSEFIKAVYPALRKQNSFSEQMQNAVKEIVGMKVTLYDDGLSDAGAIPVFRRVDRMWGDLFCFSFSNDIKPQLTALSKSYVSYLLHEISNFSSEFHFRLYEICRSSLYRGGDTITTFHLRRALGIADHEYEHGGHLWARVIKPSIDAINANARIRVEAIPIKEPRNGKIHAYQFIVKNASKRHLDDCDEKLLQELLALDFEEHRARELFELYESPTIEDAVRHVRARILQGEVTNPAGLIVSRLRTSSSGGQVLQSLQPNWDIRCRGALQIYRSASADDRMAINRQFVKEVLVPRQMLDYRALFEAGGIENQFMAAMLARYLIQEHPLIRAKTAARADAASRQRVDTGQGQLFN